MQTLRQGKYWQHWDLDSVALGSVVSLISLLCRQRHHRSTGWDRILQCHVLGSNALSPTIFA